MIDEITRHGKITSNFVYIISKLLAKQYLKSDPNYHNDLKYIKNFLGNLKGPLMKIGQIIATQTISTSAAVNICSKYAQNGTVK